MSVRALTARLNARKWLILATVIGLLALQLAHSPAARADEGSSFVQTDLVSDLPGAKFLDPKLKNPWGLALGPTSPWWVADNNGNVSTLYTGNGNPFSLVVDIPTPTTPKGGAPTGIVFNSNPHDFVVPGGGAADGSRFIFATEDGTIAGWNPTFSLTQAVIAVDNSNVPPGANNGAVYKGLAMAETEEGQMLYAANFRTGKVDVYDSKWDRVEEPGAFLDNHVPDGFAPFGIQEIGGRIFVSYAKQKPDRHDDLSGPGNGFVDIFNTEGRLLKRLIKHGALNSPWGMALAPEGFGDHEGDLLVGNFGDGRINAYNIESGEFRGPLRRPDGSAVEIPGLWDIAFGNGAIAGPKTTLFFAAGINDEKDGLFGSLQVAKAAESD